MSSVSYRFCPNFARSFSFVFKNGISNLEKKKRFFVINVIRFRIKRDKKSGVY